MNFLSTTIETNRAGTEFEARDDILAEICRHLLICKGAIEEIFAVCSSYCLNGEVDRLDESHLETAKEETNASKGIKVKVLTGDN
jgi:magnesium-transporting ATPase (P-type)